MMAARHLTAGQVQHMAEQAADRRAQHVEDIEGVGRRVGHGEFTLY
jgi:hypothetical protein